MNKWIENLKKRLSNKNSFVGFVSSENGHISKNSQVENSFVSSVSSENGHISENLENNENKNNFVSFVSSENDHISENFEVEKKEIMEVMEKIFECKFIDENSALSDEEHKLMNYLSNKGLVSTAEISAVLKMPLYQLKPAISALQTRMLIVRDRGKISLNIKGREFLNSLSDKNLEKQAEMGTDKTDEINTHSEPANENFEKQAEMGTDKTDEINTHSEPTNENLEKQTETRTDKTDEINTHSEPTNENLEKQAEAETDKTDKIQQQLNLF